MGTLCYNDRTVNNYYDFLSRGDIMRIRKRKFFHSCLFALILTFLIPACAFASETEGQTGSAVTQVSAQETGTQSGSEKDSETETSAASQTGGTPQADGTSGNAGASAAASGSGTQSTPSIVNDADEDENPRAVIRDGANGKHYLYNPDTNEIYTGKKGVKEVPKGSGFFYCFTSAKGTVQADGWFTRNNKNYYADPNGQLKRGLNVIESHLYYFGMNTCQQMIGWKKIQGKFYYFTKNAVNAHVGAMVTGWLKLDNKLYYLNPDDNNARATGLLTIQSRNTYYFNKKGVLQTGLIKTGSGTMYANNNGVLQKGWVTVGGKKYYFDTKSYFAYTGRHTIGGKTYNFNSDGSLVVNTTPTGPWSIKVNQGTCVVTVYRGSTPVKAFPCSVGLNGATPNGTFSIKDHLRWHELMGPSWGQWCSHITSGILFHSIPYNGDHDIYSMSIRGYNMLGQPASHGCIRLAAVNAKYIYDFVPIGTPVTIFRGTAKDDPLGKPSTPYAPNWGHTYDPTVPIATQQKW